jgi:hypothetical protein
MRTRHVRPLPLSAWLPIAGVLALTMLLATAHAQRADRPSVRTPAKTHTSRMNREHWRREAVGRWVPERGADLFLILNADGTCREAWYAEGSHRAVGVGRYTVTADGSVRVTTRLHGAQDQETFFRRGDSLYCAVGPVPWVRWDKERGAHHPPAPVKELLP